VPDGLKCLNNKWRAWNKRSLLERAVFFPCWCLLGCARLAVLIIPFRFIARYLGRQAGTLVFSTLLTPAQTARARVIGRSIELAARYTPWQSLCQPQAMVACLWLGLLGIPYLINYGVRKNALGQLEAHAWACSGSVFVTGGNAYADFVVVRTFVGPRRWAQACLSVSQ
jgi:Transglutaminase-like superfamily